MRRASWSHRTRSWPVNFISRRVCGTRAKSLICRNRRCPLLLIPDRHPSTAADKNGKDSYRSPATGESGHWSNPSVRRMRAMALRRLFRNALRATRDVLLGPPEVDLILRLAREDGRWSTMCEAIEYINYEKIPGDILEFGVFTGVSLALLTKAQSFDPKGVTRRVVGFDAFEGLPASIDVHARWRCGDCTTINGWHPFLSAGERVTSETVRQLFVAC